MERWFEFMGSHPFLFGLLAVLAVLFFMVESKRSGKKITPNELGLLTNNQNARLIDIRPVHKFSQGYIQGSQNIPFAELKTHISELNNSNVPIVFICDMGLQASAAVHLLSKTDVYRLDGGIAGWQAVGMPLVGANTKKK